MRWWLCVLISTVACGGTANKSATSARTGTAPIATGDHGRGISLSGAGAYGDRHDPSGWSGVSTNPSAVGGGPKAAPSVSATAAPAASVSAEPASAKPKPPAKSAPSAAPAPAPTLPPSKELDTSPPSKDLQF